jgi:hypothetical protein
MGEADQGRQYKAKTSLFLSVFYIALIHYNQVQGGLQTTEKERKGEQSEGRW